MRVPSHTSDRRRADATMTPMIDVVFLLLVFFVATASFQVIEYVLPGSLAVESAGESPLELPPELVDLEQVIVKIGWQREQPTWSVNDNPFNSLAEVRGILTELARFDAGLPVILDVAPPVPIGEVIRAYDASRIAGLMNIQFAASAAP